MVVGMKFADLLGEHEAKKPRGKSKFEHRGQRREVPPSLPQPFERFLLRTQQDQLDEERRPMSSSQPAN
jgi:hypothetical protein